MTARRTALAGALAGLLVLAAPAGAGAPERAELLAARCAFCHGEGGRSVSPLWPALAAQPEAYLADQLRAYALGADGPRQNMTAAQMYAIAQWLSDEEIKTLAAYFAAERSARGVARTGVRAMTAAERKTAEALHKHGTEAVPACASCHGAGGEGEASLRAPRLAGQHARYFERQMQAYRDGTRIDPAGVMQAIAEALTPDETAALAGFYEELGTGR
jgi:cytochrome c553